jgi:hypothetical protein
MHAHSRIRRSRLHLTASALSAASGLGLASAAHGGFSYAFAFGFPPLTEMAANGSTDTSNLIRLTTGGGQAGSVFAVTPQDVSGGFSTSFMFRIVRGPAGIVGDGFAFVLHNDPSGPAALGSGGSGIGYDGIQKALVIEFDTFCFPNEFPGTHVSVQTGGADVVTASDSASLAHALLSPPTTAVDITDERFHVVRIDYLPPSPPDPGTLNVYLDEGLVLTTPLDLQAVPDDGSGTVDLTDGIGTMFAGFTAGSGLADSVHIIGDWSFDEGGCVPPYGFLGWSGWGGPGSELVMGGRFGGTGPVTYQWSKDGQDLVDGGRINGATTFELTINDSAPQDEGLYQLTVSGACGSLVFDYPIDLTPACNRADVTDIGDTGAGPDNQLTVDDIIAYVNVFSDGTGCPGEPGVPCNMADITDIGDTGSGADGQLTVDDIIAFVNAFSDGCA